MGAVEWEKAPNLVVSFWFVDPFFPFLDHFWTQFFFMAPILVANFWFVFPFYETNLVVSIFRAIYVFFKALSY